jgi:hypothetical protein
VATVIGAFVSSHSNFHKPTATQGKQNYLVKPISHRTSPKTYVTPTKQQRNLSRQAHQVHPNYILL